MNATVLGILLANVAYALLGLGLAALLGVFDRRESVVLKALLSGALGIAAIGLVASYAALAGVAVAPVAVVLLAVTTFAAGGWRVRARSRRSPSEPAPPSRLTVDRVLAVVPALAIGAFVLAAARAIAVKPLAEWDGWVLWATKARILYERPAEAAEILRGPSYGAPSYPPGLPALEATTMRAAGTFDSVLVDLQLLILVAAALAGLWALLSAVAHPLLIGLALLAPLASPELAYQLTTNYADVPLAFVVALGLAAGAAWLAAGNRREPWQLACFALFLSFAAWTKNEGLVFGLAAIAALAVATLVERRGRLAVLAAASAFAVLVAPWRVYASVHDLRTYDYDLASLFDPSYLAERSDRVAPAARELLSEMTQVDTWGATVAVLVLGVATALLTSRRIVGLYASVWLALSFCGLVATYWISSHRLDNDLENSSHRTVLTLLVGGLCLVPALLQSAVPPRPRPRSGRLQGFWRGGDPRERIRLLRASTRRGPRARQAAS